MNTDTKTSMYDDCWDKIFPQSDKVNHQKIFLKTAMVLILLEICIFQKILKIRNFLLLLFVVDLEQ